MIQDPIHKSPNTCLCLVPDRS